MADETGDTTNGASNAAPEPAQIAAGLVGQQSEAPADRRDAALDMSDSGAPYERATLAPAPPVEQTGAEAMPPPKRHRVLLGAHNAAHPPQEQPPENDYERQRFERIKRNEAVMQQLGLRRMAASLGPDAAPPLQPTAARQRRERRPAPLPPPSRRSSRALGIAPESHAGAAADAGAAAGDGPGAGTAGREAPEDEALEIEEYFRREGRDVSDAIRIDGEYRGWVEPVVAQLHGIFPEGHDPSAGGGGDASAAAAAAGPARLKGKGWSEARAWSATQLRTNPNAYFYRHVAPGKQQAHGEWSEVEHAVFMRTLRAFGGGSKWGLFASHVGTRVGYQCRSYYANVVLPSGAVIDARFKMQRSGKPVPA